MKLEGSVVIVTGASAGIGRATADLLATRGANVVITARRVDRLAELAKDLSALPGRRLVVPGDIQDEAFALELVARTLAEFGRIDVLVNNAGLGHHSLLVEMSSDDMRTVIDTNLMGLLYITKAAVPQMKKQERGHIVNVSSIASQFALPNRAIYCASKMAVNCVSRSLRMELRPYHIAVTLVYPGRTATEFNDARLGGKGASRGGLLPKVAADRVARSIVRAIQTGRREVYVTWTDWLVTTAGRLLPRTADWFVERATRAT